MTSTPRPLENFPTPAELQARYEQRVGFQLTDPAAKPLLTRYSGGEAARRYYQDAAIRAVLEKLARCEHNGEPRRALLSLATGAGKTFIAVHLLKRIADAGLLKRALFVCDREELRSQALLAFQNVFGADAAVVKLVHGINQAKNARIHIATYQTLGVENEAAGADFLTQHYPEGYFSHIVIDECHRSAWGQWSQVLTRYADAAQIGLTATPRQLERTEASPEVAADVQITADNLKYFGDPVYEYTMAQAIEDGYLAACEIVRRDIFLDQKAATERETGLDQADLEGKQLLDPITGQSLTLAEAKAHYAAGQFEATLLLKDRVEAMAKDLFTGLLASGGPEQKTIIFCVRDSHADLVAEALNNLYAYWCAAQGRERLDPYAFKCTAAGGSEQLSELRGAERRNFIAVTVDLLTTGVDVPWVRNIVFFKYVRSPIAFYQMVGRGTRLHPASGKLMFRLYDYTNATRLFGQDFYTQAVVQRHEAGPDGGEKERQIQVEGIEVHVSDAGRYILTDVDGKALPVTVEEYKQRLAERVLAEAATLEEFRARWVDPAERRALMARLPDGGRAPALVRQLEELDNCDLYDVLAELAYGLAPKSRQERAAAFSYKNLGWLNGLPAASTATLLALAMQFSRAGVEGLENPRVFQTPEVQKAGGLDSLRVLGKPVDVLKETKIRLFAA